MKLISDFKKNLCGNNDQDKSNFDGPVDFEDAILYATKFGKYNFFLMMFVILTSFAFIFDTTVMSYVIPSAECDLNLSLLDKGMLNAVVHAGMICSAIIAGYLADTIGRRKVLVGGLLLDAICNLLATFSHHFILTLLMKFLAGFFVAGTTTVQVTMMAEFHAAKYRPPIVMFVGVTFSMAMLTIPLIAWLILAKPFTLYIGNYEYFSWQVFMAVCSIPSTLGALWAFFIPESPKFLISRNRLTEALTVMEKIYTVNTGKSADSFPVKQLKGLHQDEKDSNARDGHNAPLDDNIQQAGIAKVEGALVAIRGGIKQLKPLFSSEYLPRLLLMFCIQFAGITGLNSLRLWLPQLFKMMTDYGDKDGTLCDMISLGNRTIIESPMPENATCEPISVNPQTYINSTIVAAVQIGLGTVASLIVNYVGKRRLLVTALIGAGVGNIGLYLCANTTQATALAALDVALTSVSINVILSILVDLFPTTLRAMAVSLIMMIGRFGSITGNLTFPILLAIGCLPPFLALACVLFGGGVLALFIPASIKNDT